MLATRTGKQWVPAETDVSIRPGWFYHPAEDAKVRSGKNLVNLYYQSVGRNSLLLLNVPPNREGLFSEPDIASLKEFRSILDETFKTNLVARQPKLTDGKLATFTTLSANQPLVLELNGEQTFDRIAIQENIATGQRVASGKIEYWNGTAWQPLQTFTTVGYKRLMRFPAVKATKLRLSFTNTNGPVQLAEVGVYKASAREE